MKQSTKMHLETLLLNRALIRILSKEFFLVQTESLELLPYITDLDFSVLIKRPMVITVWFSSRAKPINQNAVLMGCANK